METAPRHNLAKKTVHVQTISKIERGDLREVSKKTLEALAAALKVEPAVLTGEAPMPEETQREPGYRTERVTLGTEQWQAVSAIALRYNVTENTVLEFAPTLFAIFAEQSLAQRSTDLCVLKEKQRALYDAGSKLPHLGPAPRLPWDVADRIIDAERKSIESLDLFARTTLDAIDPFPDPRDDLDPTGCLTNPFLGFVKQAGENVGFKLTRRRPTEDMLELVVEQPWFDTLTGGDKILNKVLAADLIHVRDIPASLLGPDRLTERKAWLRQRLQNDSIQILAHIYGIDLTESGVAQPESVTKSIASEVSNV